MKRDINNNNNDRKVEIIFISDLYFQLLYNRAEHNPLSKF